MKGNLRCLLFSLFSGISMFWRTLKWLRRLSFFCSLELYWFFFAFLVLYHNSAKMSKIKTLKDIMISDYNIKYAFQIQLTEELDEIDWDFNQDILNKIVLWKVNRYAYFDNETLKLLNSINKTSKNLDIPLTKKVLEKLLRTKWVQLAMASTILRFKNPHTYQIIDQRVYRIIYGDEMPKSSKKDVSIALYIEYLQKLQETCIKYNIDFSESDRVLYVLDKDINSSVKIKY